MPTDYGKLREERLAKLDATRRAPYENLRPPLRSLGVEGMRARGEAVQGKPVEDPSVPFKDVFIEGPNGPVPTRIYAPQGAGPKGIYIHIHAGGYIMLGGLDTMVNANTQLAKATGCIIVAPDFRLPPEHPFPIGLNDCWAVLKWVGENAAAIGGDPNHIGIGGGCTGGSFAAVLCLMARDAGAPKVAAQYLAATVFDCRCDYKSQFENGSGYTLSYDDGQFVIEVYLKDMENRWDWRASPILVPSVAGVAPAYICAGEWDILRDESRAYADRLKHAGVDVTFVCMPEESHAVGPGNAAKVRDAMISFLKSRLDPKAPHAS